MQSSDINVISQHQLPLRSIGIRQDIVPKHVIKWTYRQGIGKQVKPGQILLCVIGCSLIDGKDIIVPKQFHMSKFLIGRKSLILGLELALQKSKKGQVFKLKVSSDYAYGQRQDIKDIPPFSTLIFDITVIDIVTAELQGLSQNKLIIEIECMIQKADNQLMKQNFQKSIQILFKAFSLSLNLRSFHFPLSQKVLVKIANTYLSFQKPEKALQILSQYQEQIQQYFLMTECKLKILALVSPEKIKQQLIKKYNGVYAYNTKIRRRIVQQLKRLKDKNALKQLEGYDYKQDVFVEVLKPLRSIGTMQQFIIGRKRLI